MANRRRSEGRIALLVPSTIGKDAESVPSSRFRIARRNTSATTLRFLHHVLDVMMPFKRRYSCRHPHPVEPVEAWGIYSLTNCPHIFLPLLLTVGSHT